MTITSQLSLKQKFIILSGLLLLTTGVIIVSQWVVIKANNEIMRAYQNRYTSYLLADELRQSSDDLTRLVRAYVATGQQKWKDQYDEVVNIRAGKQARPAGYEGIYWDFRAADINMSGQPGPTVALLDMMRAQGFDTEELDKLKEANDLSTSLAQTESQAIGLTATLAAQGEGRLDTKNQAFIRANEMVNGAEYLQKKAAIMVPINDFFKLLDQRTADSIAQAQDETHTWQIAQAIVVLIMLAVFFALLYSSFQYIIRSIRLSMGFAQSVSRGDLTTDVKHSGTDEVAQLMQALNEMQTGLGSLVTLVRGSSSSVAMASAEISQGSMDLSARTSSQASALQQTAASMEQLSVTVRHNADNAKKANDMSQEAAHIAQEGGNIVTQVIDTMHEISDKSQKITDIVGMIDAIAFQTNILALNAAVEAARAGESGRGFAVVAAEVRALAQRAASAAKDIRHLIDESALSVNTGSELVERSGSTMNNVVNSIDKVKVLVGEISASNHEQSSGVNQIGQAVAQMDQDTQQNAALVEQMTAAAGNLNQQAQDLVRSVAVFKVREQYQVS
ncbi:methyl-accepting chemotaxis protein [Castellaniella sp.]|uniref:methyl-accepting chemotaxis protein n=1 Tax=Castellaniella sp. TaxID=1955812 RepID=UPI002AFF9C27|nr:methyl-accepting chemotaxis protein [Castellaniella sp.]